jgi:hypothetical protein
VTIIKRQEQMGINDQNRARKTYGAFRAPPRPTQAGNTGDQLPAVINVYGAVPAEDGVGGRVERRLRQSDIDPDFAINVFTLNSPAAGTYERGQTVSVGSSPQAAITYESGTPDTGTITNSYGGSSNGSDIALGSWLFSSPFATATVAGSVKRLGADHGADPTLTITLNVNQGVINDSSTKLLTWTSRVYWGLGSSGGGETVNASFITGLSNSQVRSSKGGTISVTPSNQYVYFAIPTDYGTPTFTLNGFPFAASKIQSATNITNAYSVTRQYDIWRSDNLLTSATALSIIVS